MPHFIAIYVPRGRGPNISLKSMEIGTCGLPDATKSCKVEPERCHIVRFYTALERLVKKV